MAVQDGRHLEMITQLLRHVTSLSNDADVKGDIFRSILYLPSHFIIALYSRRYEGGRNWPSQS